MKHPQSGSSKRIGRLASGVVIFAAAGILVIGGASIGGGDLVLFDTPKGAWLGSLRGDASLVVLEERDGWRHVRVEGWVPVGSAATVAPSDSPPRDFPARSGMTGAIVQGVLASSLETGGAPGAGVLVLLLRDDEALDRSHRQGGEECRGRLQQKDREMETRSREAGRALNSSDNFREAASRNDHAKDDLARAQRERQQLLKDCRARALQIFEPYTTQRAISDGSGRFEFRDVGAGKYRAVALEASGDRPRSWSFSFAIDAGGGRVLDAASDRTPIAADWDLR